MSDLDDLLEALAKVRDAKAESDDEDRDPNDESDTEDEDENNPYANDDADKENDEDDEEDDFSKPRALNTVMFLEKRLTEEAEDKAFNDRKTEAIRAGVMRARTASAKPMTKAEQDAAKLYELRIKTAKAERELKTVKMLEAEFERLEKVSLELYKANMTDKERKERDAHTHTMALWAAGICPEASPDWREDATIAFRNRKL